MKIKELASYRNMVDKASRRIWAASKVENDAELKAIAEELEPIIERLDAYLDAQARNVGLSYWEQA